MRWNFIRSHYSIFIIVIIGCSAIDGYTVIGGWNNNKIYRLSDDGREWIEVGGIRGTRYSSAAASLNEKVYIAGGYWSLILYDK